jgi:hypothetical protein
MASLSSESPLYGGQHANFTHYIMHELLIQHEKRSEGGLVKLAHPHPSPTGNPTRPFVYKNPPLADSAPYPDVIAYF